jgi:protein ImuB
MTLAQARALAAGLTLDVRRDRPQRDAAALEALGQWALRFSPLVAPDPPDGLLLDITGCARLFHGEANLVARLCAEVGGLNFQARAATAPTLGAAWAVARFGSLPQTIVMEAELREILAPLPVSALRLDEKTVAALAEVNIRRIGHLLTLPTASLGQRFGGDLLRRLDQALGRRWETLEPIRPQIPPQAERTFAGPVCNGETIHLAARELVDRLCAELGQRQSGALRLDLDLARSDLEPLRLSLALSGPSREAAHLWALLSPQLERANLGFGVEKLVLTAARIGLLPHEQTGGLSAAPGAGRRRREFGELLDLMTNRFGADRVTQVEIVESHVPERSFSHRPAARTQGRSAAAAVTRADRPSLLFARPESAEVITVQPDGPLLWLRWRGQERRVVSCVGPERIAPEWWRSSGTAATTRDYFQLQDETGAWLWIFRELETARWYVHGLWA